MEKITYSSDRYFRLFDVHVSLSQIMFRSMKSDEHPFNIDIIFKGCDYVQVFGMLHGIAITKLSNPKDVIGYDTVNKLLTYDNNYIFEIKSNNEKYYLAAAFFHVYKNQFDFLESSLNYRDEDRGIVLYQSF